MADRSTNDSLRIDIARRVSSKRTEMKMSQAELAKKTNIKRATISAIERAERDILSSTIVDLTKALGISQSYLLTGKPDANMLILLGEDISKYTPSQQEHLVRLLKFEMKHFDDEAKRKRDRRRKNDG